MVFVSDDFMTVKRRDHKIDDGSDEEAEKLEPIPERKSKKALTKAAAAKKLLKMSVPVNQKVGKS